ncbi:helix-turn-helix transcriptional regulator [Gordonia sp. MP11Mi]
MIDREGLAGFLRRRRAALQPIDVGLRAGARRRTPGLRREEVAALCHMSVDYYARLERQAGPTPSVQMIGSIAQGMRLSRDERDHLFRLAGHEPPTREADREHVSPGMLRIFDRLREDTIAEIVTELGETLHQTRLSVALVGDLCRFTGPARSIGYRWFTDESTRDLYPEADHDHYSRMYAAGLRAVRARRGPDSTAESFVTMLSAQSGEFRRVWAEHEIGIAPKSEKRFVNPLVGTVDLQCQTLHDPDQANMLLVYTAVPGSDSYEKIQLLAADLDATAAELPPGSDGWTARDRIRDARA